MRAWWVLALAACDAATADRGLDAMLQIEGAQYRPGPFPADEGGPDGLAVAPKIARIVIGATDGKLSGALETTATAAIFGITGFDGAWILPAGLPLLDSPDLPSPTASFGISAAFPAGPFDLIVAGADASGRVGAPAMTTIVADVEPPPDGTLVIGLAWSGRADLDLHITDPAGNDAWSGDPNTYEPPGPGEPPDPPSAYLAGGILDHDGNRDCRRDVNPREHFVWVQPPPAGTYDVRVDVKSLCGDPIAYWYVTAQQRGIEPLLGQARGRSTADDVLRVHDAKAGVHALTFEVVEP